MSARVLQPDEFTKVAIDAVAAGPTAMATIDLDGFAAINADFGYKAGDAVLATVEKTLSKNLPGTAAIGKVGGDEWLVVFPGTSPEDALILLEEIREHLESRPAAPDVARPISARFGIAGSPMHGTTESALRRAADAAMHRAKAIGGKAAFYVEERMVMKSNYYSRAQLARLTKLSVRTERTDASLLREALDDLLVKYRSAAAGHP